MIFAIIIKLIVDTYSGYQIIAAGSSSFDLGHKLRKPITGRIGTFKLYPASFEEISTRYNKHHYPLATSKNFLGGKSSRFDTVAILALAFGNFK